MARTLQSIIPANGQYGSSYPRPDEFRFHSSVEWFQHNHINDGIQLSLSLSLDSGPFLLLFLSPPLYLSQNSENLCHEIMTKICLISRTFVRSFFIIGWTVRRECSLVDFLCYLFSFKAWWFGLTTGEPCPTLRGLEGELDGGVFGLWIESLIRTCKTTSSPALMFGLTTVPSAVPSGSSRYFYNLNISRLSSFLFATPTIWVKLFFVNSRLEPM